MKRVSVLASGRGSNFQAIIDSVESGRLHVTIGSLITDNPQAYAIERARRAGIPVQLVDFASFRERGAYEDGLLQAMENASADLFVLAGYMRILGGNVVRRYCGRLINIHPALLPSFPGLHAQAQALWHGVKVSGCTVHFVDEGMDTGPIILQRCVPVLDDDDEESLSARILAQEHIALPEAIGLFCEGLLQIEGRRVRVLARE
ncbi:MAG: phosphoribosylglycinamide formyltransferase [Methanomicrobiaceae archaeon]|nr:phosphoribosylglycinamide formyltransferase [Methanomicrobiaceae archaeon]